MINAAEKLPDQDRFFEAPKTNGNDLIIKPRKERGRLSKINIEEKVKLGEGNFKNAFRIEGEIGEKKKKVDFVLLEIKNKNEGDKYIEIYNFLKKVGIPTYLTFREIATEEGEPKKFLATNLVKNNQKLYAYDCFTEEGAINNTICPKEIVDKIKQIAELASKNNVLIPEDGFFFTIKNNEIKDVIVGDFDSLVIKGTSKGIHKDENPEKINYFVRNNEKVNIILERFLDLCGWDNLGMTETEKQEVINSESANDVRNYFYTVTREGRRKYPHIPSYIKHK